MTVFSEIAASVGAVALALLIYHRTSSAIGAMAFFLAAEFGPAFLSPFFVARLDQSSVRVILSVLYVLEALIFLVLVLLLDSFSVAAILLLTLLDGSLAVTAGVLARSAWTSMTSPAGLLREANALANTCLSVCYMVGPALGGVLVAAGGTRAALIVNVGVFGLMAATMATARGLPNAVANRVPGAGRLRAAVARAREEPMIRRLLGLQAVGMLFFTISIPVEVVFVRQTLHRGAGGYGVLLAAWGAGAILGSTIYARWRARPPRALMALGALLLSCGFLVMAVSPVLALAVAGASIAGVGNGMQIVSMRTALQEITPPQWMALILGLNEAIFQAVPGAGFVLGGVMAAVAGPRVALGVAAAGSLLVASFMWLKLAELPTARGMMAPPVEVAESGSSLAATARQV